MRVGASGKPIDTAEDALVYLFLAGNIRIKMINMIDQVDWVTRAIMSRVCDLIYCVDGEEMGGEFCEHLLREVNSYISVLCVIQLKSVPKK